MKILVVVYYFPPFGGGASERLHNFVKYLPGYGITPLVLTVDARYYEEIYLDPKLVGEYAAEVELKRASVVFGERLKKEKSLALAGGTGAHGTQGVKRSIKKFIKELIFPDEQVFWLPPAFMMARAILGINKVETIVATGPPFSSHLLGALLSWAYGKPLILDYRDLWCLNPRMAGKGVRLYFNRLFERIILRRADKIVFTNAAAAAAMKEYYGFISNKIHIVENGFDADAIRAARHDSVGSSDARLRLNYLGSLTRERTPLYVLKALKRFVTAHPAVQLELGFVGYVPDDHKQLVHDMGLDDWVRFYGTVPKEKALDIMCNHSDILMVLQRATEGGSTAIPGKIYEYLATGKPVICMDDTGGVTSKFLRDIDIDLVAEYEDEEAIYRLLERVVLDHERTREAFAAIAARIDRYDRKHLTGIMAGLIDNRVPGCTRGQ